METIVVISIFIVLGVLPNLTGQTAGWFWLIMILVWVGIAIVMIFVVWVIPMKKQLEMQTAADGVSKFLEGPWFKGLGNYDNFFCGVLYFRDLRVDWAHFEKSSLAQLKQTPTYNIYREIIVRNSQSEKFQSQKADLENEQAFLTALDDQYKNINKPVVKKELEKAKKELDEKKAEDLLKTPEELEQEKELEKSKLVLQPFRDFSFKELTPEDITYLESLYFYYGPFYDAEYYRGYDIPITSAIFVMTEPVDEVLKTSSKQAVHKGWQINANTVGVKLIVKGFVTGDMPILFVSDSDNMLEPAVDHFLKMKSSISAYIDLKIFEMWVNHLFSDGEQAGKEVEKFKQSSTDWKKAYTELLMETTKDSLTYGAFLRDRTYLELTQQKTKAEVRWKVSLVALVALIVMFIVVISVLSSAKGLGSPSPPKLSVLFHSLCYLQFLKFLI